METFKPQIRDQESDKRLGYWAFSKELLLSLSPIILTAGAVALGRITQHRIWPLDGSMPITMWIKNKVFSKMFSKAIDKEVQLFANNRQWYEPLFEAVGVTYTDKRGKDMSNAIKALEVSVIPLAYRVWNHQEGKRLSLTESYGRLEKLEHLKPSDDELREQNASLKEQINFLDRPDAAEKLLQASAPSKIQAGDAVHRGVIDAPAANLKR